MSIDVSLYVKPIALFDSHDRKDMTPYFVFARLGFHAASVLKDSALAMLFIPADLFNASRYASGGEDGYIRIHQFDDSYFAFEFEH